MTFIKEPQRFLSVKGGTIQRKFKWKNKPVPYVISRSLGENWGEDSWKNRKVEGFSGCTGTLPKRRNFSGWGGYSYHSVGPLVRIKTITLVRSKRHHQRSIKIYWGEKTQLAQKLLFYYNGNEKTDALQHILNTR